MNKLLNNIKLSFIELKDHVTWPTWNELQESSILTLTASLIIALIVFGMDQVFENFMKVIYQLFQ